MPKDGKVAYGVKFSPDGAVVALAACRRPKTGVPFVELVAYKSMADGFGWEEATGDYSAPIDAATLAYWAVMTTKRKPGRKARIL